MVAMTALNRSKSIKPVGTLRVAKFGLIALLVGSIMNVLVLFIGLATVEFPAEFVGGPFGPLAVGPVVINSSIAAIGATLTYGAVMRYAARPNRTFIIIAGVVLVLSFAMFLASGIAGAPPRVFAVLAVMHVIAAVTIVSVLTQASNQEAGFL